MSAEQARWLFQRVPDQEYLDSCREALAQVPEAPTPTSSYLVFRLGKQWFGIAAGCASQVSGALEIRAVPNRSAELLLGLVNWRGRLEICVSLYPLFIPQPGRPEGADTFLVLELSGDLYVTPVHQVTGIGRLPHHLIERPPQAATHVSGLVHWEGELISLVDPVSLQQTLRRMVSR